jgi:hypothetical protein
MNRYSWTSYRDVSLQHTLQRAQHVDGVPQASADHLSTSAVQPGLMTAPTRPRLSKS